MAKRIIGIILTVLGALGLIGFGIGLFVMLSIILAANVGVSDYRLEGNTSFTTGEIDYVSSDGLGVYYETEDGWFYGIMPVDMTGTYYSGDYVTVEYETNDPESFTIPEVMDYFNIGLGAFIVFAVIFGILSLIGLIMIIIGIILIVSAAKKKKAMTPSYM